MPIISIQVLRALAALSVSIGHAQSFIGLPMEKQGQVFGWSFLLPWGAGVDLFFVISGFIMVYSSESLFAAPGGAKRFVWRRLTRIVPLYWCAMALLLAKIFVMHKPLPDAPSIAASFLFVPWDTFGTGFPRPVYELGWTLNYEMFFYAVFAVFLAFQRTVAVTLVALLLGVLTIAGALFAPSNLQAFFWTQPIVLEFVFGMGLALLVRSGVALVAPVRWCLIALGSAAMLYDCLSSALQPRAWLTPNDLLRVVGWGVPAAMILAGCVLKRREQMPDNALVRSGTLLGDASYALYLCHPIVMSAFASAWFVLALNTKLPAFVGILGCVLASIVASVFVHLWFERPLTRFLQARARRSAAHPASGLGPMSQSA